MSAILAVEHSMNTGSKLGPYEITRLLGEGGMGAVYRARDTRLGRDVALKVLPADFADDKDRLRRFEQEAKSLAALNHPNIMTVFDVGQHEGKPYLVSELLEGKTLREELGRDAFPGVPQIPLRKATEYALQIAQGLAAAHGKGIVHRDLKPDNLFVTKDGRVKILDFGLAKLIPVRARSPASPSVSTENAAGEIGDAVERVLTKADPDASTQVQPATDTTEPGRVMGTPAYMSPEQVRGETTDHRSDLFAFGAILYEMLGGRRAFKRDTPVETMNAILTAEPPEITETDCKIPAQLERIVQRCLEKQPERRFQSASDLGFALEALSTPSGSRLETATASPAMTESAGRLRLLNHERWMWIAATALAALTALGFAWSYFTRQPAAEERVMKLSILPPEKSSFGHLAVSPDGRYVAFTAATGAKVQLWVRVLDATEANPFAGTEGAAYPFWSPDSGSIGFFAGGKLKKIEVSGGLPATLCDVGIGTGGTWSRDGVILFSSLGGAGISRVSATGGAVTSVVRPDLKRQESDYSDPCFLPDGRHFLYSTSTAQMGARGVYLASLDGGVKERLVGDDSNAVYAPSGRGAGYLLFGREGALMAQPFDATQRRLTGEPLSVAAPVGVILGPVLSLGRRNFSVSENGVLVIDPLPNRQRNQLIWVDRGGSKTGSLDGVDHTSTLRLSPDDQRFMVTRRDLQTGNNDLWLSDVTGGNVTRFTFDPANDIFPVWSPDGSRIVWCSNRDGVLHLYEKAASGAGQDALLLKSDYFKFPTDWSRDGRFIIYRQIDPKTKYDVWVLPVGPVAGEQKPFPFLQTEANEAAAVLSPDGQWIAYTADESGKYEIYVQSFPKGGGKRQISTGGGIGPHWRGDGNELFYHAPDGKLMAVAVKGGASFEAGVPVALFEFRAGGNLNHPLLLRDQRWTKVSAEHDCGGRGISAADGGDQLDGGAKEVTMKAGSQFGPYEIVAPLGVGGMGEVFRAQDTRLSRDVAVKGVA